MVGTLPPVTGISPFCIGFVRESFAKRQVVFESIKSPFPLFLYPGTLEDPSSLVLLKALPKGTAVKNDLVWWSPLSWLKAALRTKSEIVYLNWWTIALWPMLFTLSLVCRLKGKEVVAVVHNPVGHERYPSDVFFSRLFLKTCHRYLVFNQSARDMLKQSFKINEDRIKVINHPPLDFYPHRDIPKNEARKRLGLPLEATIYLSFGRIRGYKNLETVIKQFAQIAQKDSRAHLVIAGEPWTPFEPFDELIDNLKLRKQTYLFLRFIPTPQVALFFRAADHLLLAHRDPGSGSGIQSLAAGFNLPIKNLLISIP
jgi:glycosyltransferase involved in cell wall biosynthesis